jgi:hypothetical protein
LQIAGAISRHRHWPIVRRFQTSPTLRLDLGFNEISSVTSPGDLSECFDEWTETCLICLEFKAHVLVSWAMLN